MTRGVDIDALSDADVDRLAAAAASTYPFHYRDAIPGPCPWSGTTRAADTTPCPNGCHGATTCYANDGHPECAEDGRTR